ncbi:proline dehydrogenase family protein [Deinococcus yavapaiensis]|uniref:proline dehydrogenase n=1 Tax=Deinococcus yavapaiensis KR-236 TaxID=694435 RepID=A0A318SC08_9DEIO|nr:proline dehydrogenase family protein [Deinococcus yavapaiensis]PYE54834.1 L-proline dehydrogenase [Deinococcus yavapaiensis KR-236]
MIDRIYRSAVLGVAGNKAVESVVRTRGWSVAQRFVAGDDLQDAVRAVEELERDGVHGILDLLGEMVTSEEEANTFAEKILAIMDALDGKPYPKYVSIKLSQIGQDLTTASGENLGMVNARRILTRAQHIGAFVRLDMEDHPRVDETLAQFRELASEFGTDTVGTVLQAYLYRTEQDRAALDDLHPNLRIVKGAYLEPETVAMPDKADVDAAYRRLTYAHLKAGNYTAVASHDESIIEDVKRFVIAHGIPKSQFEFQMLYGIRRDLQKRLAKEGFTVRAYIPYGRDWYAYFSRRIAERPANVLFVLRGMLKG